MNNEQCTMYDEEWTMTNEPYIEQWKKNNERLTMNNEH